MCIKAGPLEICTSGTSIHSVLRYSFAIISHYITVKLNYIWKGAAHEVDMVAHHRVSDMNFFPKVLTVASSLPSLLQLLPSQIF